MAGHDYRPIVLAHCLSAAPPPGPNAFRWEGDRLGFIVHKRRPLEPLERFAEPSQAEWKQFWVDCERLLVWDLPQEFGDPHIIDGLCVDTKVEYAGRVICVSGQYVGAPERVMTTVDNFHMLLQKLVGFPPDTDYFGQRTQSLLEPRRPQIRISNFLRPAP